MKETGGPRRAAFKGCCCLPEHQVLDKADEKSMKVIVFVLRNFLGFCASS